jgi:CheY-like chemotaxis protein
MAERAPRVLVVEDDRAIQDVLVDALVDEGWETRSARDGREALGVLERWRPDVIVLDLMTPTMDGWQFRAEQRQRPELRDIPVVVVSASVRALESADELSAPVVTKPFDLDLLLALVARAAAV